MSDRTFERAVNDWLEDGSDRTPPSAIDAVLLAVKTTPQERDLRIPWRFPFMPALSRASGLAAVALVVVVGAGALVYFGSNRPSGAGSQGTPVPTATPAPTVAPTAAPTPQPTFDPSDPAAWTTYTSAVYGFTMAYPSDWSVHTRAEHKWQPGEPVVPDGWPWADVFANPEQVDGDSMGLWVWQVPAPAGADLDTWEGLQAALLEICEVPTFGSCELASPATPMCRGQQECQPALVVSMGTEEVLPFGLFGDPEAGTITVFNIGREDDFPAAERYGGTVALLKAILTQVDVWPPQPGQTPQ